jgi:hypothetical protein
MEEEIVLEEEAPQSESEEMARKKKYPYPYEEESKLLARLENLEGMVAKIAAFVEELARKKKYPYPEEEEMAKKKKYPYPYEEEKKLEAKEEVAKAVTAGLSKEEIESLVSERVKQELAKITPDKKTVTSSAEPQRVHVDLVKVRERVRQELSAGEVFLWAERNRIKWGEGFGE